MNSYPDVAHNIEANLASRLLDDFYQTSSHSRFDYGSYMRWIRYASNYTAARLLQYNANLFDKYKKKKILLQKLCELAS